MLPAQGAGPDRRPCINRKAAAGARDRGKGRPRDAFRAGQPHHERSHAVRDPQLRPACRARGPRTRVLRRYPERWLKQVPNLLTAARLLAAPYILYLLWTGEYRTALVWFSVASFTDVLDGFLARRFNA